MAEETNPWKRQMANKQNTSVPTSSPTPPPSAPQLTNPWKQKMAQQNPGSKSISSPQPPSWKKTQTSSQNQSPVQNNPWKSGSGGSIANNPWNKGKIDKQKQAKQKQQQQRLLREQQERLKRQQQQRIKRQQQQKQKIRLQQQRVKKELQDQQRQNKLMQIQQELSKQFQKQEQQRIKQSNKSKNQLQKSTSNSPKKISKQPKVKKVQNKSRSTKQIQELDQTIANRYYKQFESLYQDRQTYNQKLESQKKLLLTYNQFKQSQINKIKQIIDSHQIPTIVNIPQSKTTLKFIKSTSKRQVVFGQQKIIYDQSKLNEAKKLVYYSNIVNNSLIDGIRKRGDIGLRSPLISLIEYRGVMCLVKSQSIQQSNSLLLDAIKVPQVQNKLKILLKQLNSTFETGLTIDNFSAKTITNTQQSQFYILYLKQNTLEPLKVPQYDLKQHQLVRSINWISQIDKIIQLPLQKYLNRSAESTILQTLMLVKKIVELYRSGQGEIDDSDFLGLIIRMDESFINILKDSGVQFVYKPKNEGLFFQAIQKLTGLQLSFDSSVFETENISVLKKNILNKGYTFDILEYIDISNKYLSLIQEGKTQLALQSFELKQSLDQIKTQQQKGPIIIQKSQFLLYQQKYQQSLEQLLKLQQISGLSLFVNIQKLIIQIKIYCGLQKQNQLLLAFNEIVTKIHFLLGQQTHFNSYIYCLLATFYLKREDKINQIIGLYNLALNIDKRIFGQNSAECGEIYLTIAHVYLNHRLFNQAKQSIQSANKAYQQSGNKTGKIECIITIAEIAFLQGDNKLGSQNLTKAIKFYHKIGKVNEIQKVLLIKYKYQKQVTEKQKILQELFELGTSFGKQRIILKSIELALRQQLCFLSPSNTLKLLNITQQEDQDIQINFMTNLNKLLKINPSISQILKQQINSYIKNSTQQSIMSQLKTLLGSQKFNQIIGLPSPS